MASVLPNVRRRAANLLDRQIYARAQQVRDLPYTLFCHQTPLFRPLAGLGRQDLVAKLANLRRAAEALDGVLVQPGEALSFWRLVGRPIRKAGFCPALGGLEGRLHVHMGGGLSQASNLLFWMAAHGPFEIVERWRHAYDLFPDVSRTQPFGSGATVLAQHRDLRIKNRGLHGVQIRLWLSPTHLCGALLSEAPSAHPVRIKESDYRLVDHGNRRFTRHNRLWRVQGDQRTFLVENNALLTYEPDAEAVTDRAN